MNETVEVILNSFFLGAGAGRTVALIGTNPHNFFLEILADHGIVIFGIICYMFYQICVRMFKSKYDIKTRTIGSSFAVAVILLSISSSSMLRLRLMWICLTMIYISSNFIKAENSKKQFINNYK